MSWAAKRRLLYGGGTFLFLVLLSGTIFYLFFYKHPSCMDGVKNGDEKGVDCGGSCSTLCTSDALTPVVLWAKAFNVSGNTYNLLAYIENPNINSGNSQAAYEFRVYDQSNTLLGTREGVTSIPKNSKFGIFEQGFVFENSKPKRVEFSFTSFGPWQKQTMLDPTIVIKHSSLLATSTVPRIEGTVTNASSGSVPRLELIAFVLDADENAVAASRTYVDGVTQGASEPFVFSWPRPFNLGVEVCEQSVDVALALDVSGSMRSDSQNPPEPFSTVKATAVDFITSLSDDDRVSVVTFGTNARVVAPLSADKVSAAALVAGLSLSTTSENTNIAEGLSAALASFASSTPVPDNRKTIILLTDGVPTEPSRADIVGWPSIFAEEMASTAAKISDIYTIGLGQKTNEGLLEIIAGSPERHFLAPTKETLTDIYRNIGKAICSKKPNVVTVIYRLLQ